VFAYSPSKARRTRSHYSLALYIVAAILMLGACRDATETSSLTSPTGRIARLRKTRADTIVVTPSAVSTQVGSTTQLTAKVQTYSGQMLSMTVTWASANTSVATVGATGLVTGVAVGSTTISANVGGTRTTVSVTVAAATTSGGSTSGTGATDSTGSTGGTGSTGSTGGTGSPVVAECSSAKSEWIFCDDFESDRLAKYFEFDNSGGAFSRTTSVGVNGSTGMRARFAAGQSSAGSLKLAFGRTPSSYIRPVDAGTAVYRDVYWRVYVRNQAGWQGGGGDKLSRAQSIANSNWAQAMVAPVWSGGSSSNWNYLMIDPHSGTDAGGTLLTTSYNDWSHIRWLGGAQSTTPIFDAAHLGQWQCVEAHVRLNDAGQSNGVFELWINGTAQPSRTGLNWVGSYSSYGINTVFLENYWNAGSPAAQERYMDNFVVSTARIGC
jgi:hypothetical protein